MTILVSIGLAIFILYELEGYFRRLNNRLDALERHLLGGKTLAEKEREK